jgi:hypothetical protein
MAVKAANMLAQFGGERYAYSYIMAAGNFEMLMSGTHMPAWRSV